MSTDLQSVLDALKTTIEAKDPKTKSLITKWLKDWNMYLQWEESFDPGL